MILCLILRNLYAQLTQIMIYVKEVVALKRKKRMFFDSNVLINTKIINNA